MNIHYFESEVNETVVQRGLDYYMAGCIVGVDEYEEGEYVLYVDGSQEYEVEVGIDEAERLFLLDVTARMISDLHVSMK